MMLIAMLFFTLGGIITSFSTNHIMLVAGRAIGGVGSGSIVVLSEIFVTGFVPRKSRSAWFGIVNLFWTLGAASGPVIAGLLVNADQWVSENISPGI
jgi:MFS family permease